MKITSADCVAAIKASPLFAKGPIYGVKRRSKQNIDGKVVRIFEVRTCSPEGNGWPRPPSVLYARVVEDGGLIVEVCDLVETERQRLRGCVEAYLKPSAVPTEEQDDIDAERFKQMVKQPEEVPEDIDTERFRKIERKR